MLVCRRTADIVGWLDCSRGALRHEKRRPLFLCQSSFCGCSLVCVDIVTWAIVDTVSCRINGVLMLCLPNALLTVFNRWVASWGLMRACEGLRGASGLMRAYEHQEPLDALCILSLQEMIRLRKCALYSTSLVSAPFIMAQGATVQLSSFNSQALKKVRYTCLATSMDRSKASFRCTLEIYRWSCVACRARGASQQIVSDSSQITLFSECVIVSIRPRAPFILIFIESCQSFC